MAWEYAFQTNGEWTAHERTPPPDYALHCFVMARAAERFFFNASYDSRQPVADLAVYRRLIRKVLQGEQPQNIPGYASLREFSHAQEALLKAECGGAWQSYLQRGNWRLIFPFTRNNQAQTALKLLSAVSGNELPLVHLARFPKQTINHCVLIFDAKESPDTIQFSAYDPNIPDGPQLLTYNRTTRTFTWPRSHYFGGGRVDVYRVYHRWNY